MNRFIIALFLLFWGVGTLEAGKRIVVDLSKQEAYAYENGQLMFSGWVSTGRPGRRTPTGHFRVLEKDIDHVSSKYPEPNGGAVMNYMLRLTDYGVAMHLGYVPNYPASHGCIRMENGFAQKMYRWANVGTPVLIKGTPPRRIDRSVRYASGSAPVRHRATRVAAAGTYYGNDPLKFMSSVPGKSESLERSLKKRSSAKRHTPKRVTENRREPMRPLAMLRGDG